MIRAYWGIATVVLVGGGVLFHQPFAALLGVIAAAFCVGGGRER